MTGLLWLKSQTHAYACHNTKSNLSFNPKPNPRLQVSTDAGVRAQGVLSALAGLYREGALYRGFAPILARALPVHMAYLPVYDFAMAALAN